MIKLILVYFDSHNANITLKIYTDVVYIHVYCLCCVKFLAPFLEKHSRYEGGGANSSVPFGEFIRRYYSVKQSDRNSSKTDLFHKSTTYEQHV